MRMSFLRADRGREREDGPQARLPSSVSRLLIVVLLLVSTAAPVWAQDPVTDDEVNRVAKTLYCPVCENQALDTCPTEACRQWRATIREQLEAGRSDEQIRQYFAEQYGERVLAAPRPEGFGLLMWVIPPLVVALGLGLYWNFLRTSKRRAPTAAEADGAADSSDDYAARLEAELRERR